MTRYYIEAYYPDGRQILGNGDGQASISRPLKRPTWSGNWRRVIANPSPRVAEYRLIRVIGNPYGAGQVVATYRPTRA